MTKPISTLSEWMAFCGREGWPPRSFRALSKLWTKYHPPGPYVVRHGGLIIRKKFDTEAEARRWALWNYASANWETIPYDEARHGKIRTTRRSKYASGR